LTFGIGSYRGVVPESYINWTPIDVVKTNCFGGLKSSVGFGFAVFGDILLRSQNIVFDVGNVRLGWTSNIL
jgi:Eukaryotic aspartyl protease